MSRVGFKINSGWKSNETCRPNSLKKTSSEYQLGLLILGSVFVLHKTNEFKEEYQQRTSRKASSDIVEGFNNLDAEQW